MAGTPPQAMGRKPFMPQRRAGESFILTGSRNGRPGRGTEAGAPIPPEQRGKAVRSPDRVSGWSLFRRFTVSPFRSIESPNLQ